MAEADDIVARLDAIATCIERGSTSYQGAAVDAMREAATALTEQAAQIERLTRERDEAIREMSEWASKSGEAEGRLKASEWAGVVEGWKDRATTAERERDEARAEVERKDAALSILAEPANWRTGGLCDPNSGAFIAETIARAALTKGGENGQS